MQKYFFLLGNTPDLSKLELARLFPEVSEWREVLPNVLLVDFGKSALKIEGWEQKALDLIGGTVKIIRIEDEEIDPKITVEDLEQLLVDRFATRFERVKLAVSELGRDHLPKIEVGKVKRVLENSGVPVRYLAGSRHGLEAAILLHKTGVEELYFIQGKIDGETKLWLGKTVGVQNIDLWTLKDRAKPYFDRKKGMLPPKLARMMVNIAVGDKIWNERAENQGLRLYDPFCGTGTVLMEALQSGMTVLGSDLDVKAVLGTQENLEFLTEKLNLENEEFVQDQEASEKQRENDSEKHFITKDVALVNLSDIGGQRVNYLVTEPFLGKQTPKEGQLPGIFQGLERMYWGAFKNWTEILADEAEVVMVWPVVDLKTKGARKVYSLEGLIDKITQLGYIMSFDPVIYAREGAIVQRQIIGFRFNKNK